MECCHARNVLHGDLKASNVLISVTEAPAQGEEGEEGCNGEVEIVPKVADFGLSRMIADGATHHSTHTMGTITHQAPGVGQGSSVGCAAGCAGCCAPAPDVGHAWWLCQ